ncbi:tetratricopeptide repeat protein [bacterium]|nr:tetratricopeptide repeat protein [candidate division CSSED10-310 bacterium]
MKKNRDDIIVSFTSAMCFTIFGLLLGLLLYKFSHSSLNASDWITFLNWRLPFILVLPSLMIRAGSLFFSVAISRAVLKLDLWSYLTIIPSIVFSLMEQTQLLGQLWFGVLYFSILIFKTALMLWIIFRVAGIKSQIIPKLLFSAFLWFFLSYAGWEVPVHKVTGDEPHYLLMTHSLLKDGNLNLFDEYQNLEYADFYSGFLVPKPSDYIQQGIIKSRGLGATFSIMLIPGYLLGGYTGSVILLAFMSALLISFAYRLYVTVSGNTVSSIISSAIIGFSVPILIYSPLVYPDIIAALLIILALNLLTIPPKSKQGRSVPLYIVILTALLLFLKFRYTSVIVLIILGTFYRSTRRKRKPAIFLVSAIILFLCYLLIDKFYFEGDLFLNRFGGKAQILSYLPGFSDGDVLLGLFLDQEAGLLWLSPVFWLALPGIRLWPQKHTSIFWVSLLALPLTAISLMGHFAWHCMPTPPLRYLLPVLPCVGLFMAITFKHWVLLSPIQKLIGFSTIIYSFFTALLLSLQPAFQINMADGTASLFQAISSQLHTSITRLLPSFTRPSAINLFWITFFILLLIFGFKKPGKICQSSLSYAPFALLVLLVASALFILGADSLPLRTIHAEDISDSHPDAGSYYPPNPDPFFHRETDYGWTISPGESIKPSFPVVSGYYKFVIRGKLEKSSFVTDVFLENKGKVLGFGKLSSRQWHSISFPVFFNETSSPDWRIFTTGEPHQKVTVDYLELVPASPTYAKCIYVCGEIADRCSLTRLSSYCFIKALLQYPGDPYYDLRNYFNPTQIKPEPLLTHEKYPLTEHTMDTIADSVISTSWKQANMLETLFRFSLFSKIDAASYHSYFQSCLQNGSWIHSKFNIRQLMSKNGADDPQLYLYMSLCSFRDRQFDQAIEYLSNYQNAIRKPINLTQPHSHLDKTNPLKTELLEMSNDPEYRNATEKKLRKILLTGLSAFREQNIDLAAVEMYNLYNLDKTYFFDCFPLQSIPFTSEVSSAFPEISLDDTLEMSRLLLMAKRNSAALIWSERALQKDPVSSRVRYFVARALFHNFRYEEAEQQCLIAITMKFNDDRIRNLLEVIRTSIVKRSEKLGSALEHG